jgi:hypothetical protein
MPSLDPNSLFKKAFMLTAQTGMMPGHLAKAISDGDRLGQL